MAYKIFFTTDIHGSERCYRKFINASKFYGAQAIILGGDMTGKAVVPVVKESDGSHRASIANNDRHVTDNELPALLDEIRFNGFYPYVTTPGELAQVEADPDGKAGLFRNAIRESLIHWMSLAEERLKPLGTKVYISPGNDDDFIVDEVLGSSTFVINPEEQIVEIGPGMSMLTFGYSNPTPWNSPRELPEDQLFARLSPLAEKMSYDGISIYNIHVPPVDTPIDQAAQLDASFKPVVHGGHVNMIGAGSKTVRDLIMKYQPSVGLHGHIHESAGAIRLGKTICINPGSEYSDGILRGCLLTIDEKKKKVAYQLTMG
jgi:Icc-related predicted phosphoesterase